MLEIFDQLERQLSDNDEGLNKRLDEVTTMFQEQENKLLAKIDSLQSEVSMKMDYHHLET